MSGKFLYISAFITITIIIGSIFVVSTDWENINKPSENVEIQPDKDTIEDYEGIVIEDENIENKQTVDRINYLDYSEDSLSESIISDEIVVLFFHAAWCPTCKVADKDILENKDSKDVNISILKVDYDSETALINQFSIITQHTFVQIDKNGNEIKRWTGGGLEEIISQTT